MSNHLHLRSFTGRPAAVGPYLAHHAINPASQPILSCIPALTLPSCYAKDDAYSYSSEFLNAATNIGGAEFALMLQRDLHALEDRGRLGIADEVAEFCRKYAAVDIPAAREIIDWLTGGYAITGEMLRTQ